MRRPPASLAGTACLLVLTGTALGQARLTARTPARTAGVEAGAAARPAPAADRVQRFSPAVEAVLATWYEATRGVRRLEGEHTEIQYSNAFGVEYRRQGQFFYEAPDHGRIDLAPTDVTGLKSLRKLPNGQPFTVQAGTPERWICDGTQILSIDDEKRQVSPVPIPAEQRGSNIMDGPLPFLLGMPPEKVRRRFRVTLHAHGSKPGPDVAAWLRDPAVKTVMLDIRPRLEQDAQNWERAEVHLVKPTFLPSAVQLTSPGGEQQTVYRFGELTVNAGAVKRFFTGDPFEPNLRGYKTAQLDPSAGAPAANGVPSVVGLNWEQAKQVLETRGYKPQPFKGPEAPSPNMTYRAIQQKPKPGAAVPPGTEVAVWLYRPAAAAGTGKVRPIGGTK